MSDFEQEYVKDACEIHFEGELIYALNEIEKLIKENWDLKLQLVESRRVEEVTR